MDFPVKTSSLKIQILTISFTLNHKKTIAMFNATNLVYVLFISCFQSVGVKNGLYYAIKCLKTVADEKSMTSSNYNLVKFTGQRSLELILNVYKRDKNKRIRHSK